MIIHQDSLLVLDYEPSTDILTVKWPNLIDVPSIVIENSFTMLSDAIKHYNITKLLLDSRGTESNISDEDYKPLTAKLVMSFAESNLKKIARVVSEDPAREKRAQEHTSEFRAKMRFNFASQDFPDKKSAIEWLGRD